MSTSLRDYLITDSNILVTDVICTWPLESRGISITSAVGGNVTFTCCKHQLWLQLSILLLSIF